MRTSAHLLLLLRNLQELHRADTSQNLQAEYERNTTEEEHVCEDLRQETLKVQSVQHQSGILCSDDAEMLLQHF